MFGKPGVESRAVCLPIFAQRLIRRLALQVAVGPLITPAAAVPAKMEWFQDQMKLPSGLVIM
jgi:hypothetical protein